MIKRLKNLALADIKHIRSPNQSPRRKTDVRMVVLHYTAGGNGVEDWFSKPRGRESASAHYVVHRNGKIVQMVDLDQSAWHAGWNAKTSYLRERWGIIKPNQSSVGIEITNWGLLYLINGVFRTWIYYDKDIEGPGPEIPEEEVAKLEDKYWHVYTKPQIITVAQLVTNLCSELNIPRRFMFDGQPGIDYGGYHYDKVPYYLPEGVRLAGRRFKNNAGICGHCHISRAKDDPGPAIELWKGVLGIK